MSCLKRLLDDNAHSVCLLVSSRDGRLGSTGSFFLFCLCLLPCAPIPLFQRLHPALTGLSIPGEEDRERFWLYNGRYLDLLDARFFGFPIRSTYKEG